MLMMDFVVLNIRRGYKVDSDARDICNKGNLHLHKSVSNCTPVLEYVPQTEIAEQLLKKTC